MQYSGQFIECDTCRAKCGTPDLCKGCLYNRKFISDLIEIIKQLQAKVTSGAIGYRTSHCDGDHGIINFCEVCKG